MQSYSRWQPSILKVAPILYRLEGKMNMIKQLRSWSWLIPLGLFTLWVLIYENLNLTSFEPGSIDLCFVLAYVAIALWLIGYTARHHRRSIGDLVWLGTMGALMYLFILFALRDKVLEDSLMSPTTIVVVLLAGMFIAATQLAFNAALNKSCCANVTSA